jgi:hypothetical protein
VFNNCRGRSQPQRGPHTAQVVYRGCRGTGPGAGMGMKKGCLVLGMQKLGAGANTLRAPHRGVGALQASRGLPWRLPGTNAPLYKYLYKYLYKLKHSFCVLYLL